MIRQVAFGGRPIIPVTMPVAGRNIMGMPIPGGTPPAVLKPSVIASGKLPRPVVKPGTAIAAKEMLQPGLPAVLKTTAIEPTAKNNLMIYGAGIAAAALTAYLLRNKKPVIRIGAAAAAGFAAFKLVQKQLAK